MKRFIILALFSLISFTVLADGDKHIMVSETTATISVDLLRPSSPQEATFEDETLSENQSLFPTTPKEATFEDDVDFIFNLQPTTPKEATFDE